ncbi:fumarylacetoacetate hydrolase family protein [Thermogemmatispora sp.]|uniref:fumarylacetoacetate hydrolase family protein n=1 Tax=Thermogemmatispora sp. TaxID=1968838 RepID=UPI0035E43AE0
MKVVTYEHEGRRGVGLLVRNGVIPTDYSDMLTFLRSGEEALAAARTALTSGRLLRHPRLLAPLATPGKMLFSGVNYRSHLEENPTAVLPEYPQVFAKLPSAIIGPEEAIILPTPESQVDYEVELAVVIGKTARKVARAEALNYVFGYTVVNDVSARDVQFRDQQITTGKGYDTFCPLGPVIVTADEIPDPQRLRLASFVNGEQRQAATTAEMIFGVAELIAFLSAHITLYPGDVLSTGTPAGVGCFRQPPLYLKEGDCVEVEVEAIGRLKNTVVRGW